MRGAKKIEVNSSVTNKTTHYAVVRNDDLERLIAEQVARTAGISLDGDGVSFICHVRTSMGSTSFESKAEVTITVDHLKQPGIAEVES